MKIKSSFFHKTWDNLMTIKPGYWVPILCKPLNIGDKGSIGVNDVVRNFARVAPTYGIESLRIAAFQVQNKDIWDGWWNFRTGGPDNTDTSSIPYMIHSHAKGDVGFNSLTDYLSTAPALTFYDMGSDSSGNLTFTANQQALRSRCLAERAYAKIGRDWLCREDLEDPDVDYPLSTAGAENGEDLITNRQLFPCHWNRDYFTNQQTSQSKGAQVVVPVGTEAPVYLDDRASNSPLTQMNIYNEDGTPKTGKYNQSGVSRVLGVGKTDAKVSSYEIGSNYFGNADFPYFKGVARLDEATGFSLRTLNLGVAVELIGNMLMRHGSKPIEFMNTFFGVKSSDARLDRSIFLGSYSTNFITSPVTQTSSSDGVSAQGHQAGQGFHAAKYPRFKFYAEEDGWLMILCAIRPKTAYCQGLPAYHNYNSRYDYINPVFQHLDYTASKNSELVAVGVANGNDNTNWDDENLPDNGKFGLHPIFQEWRSGFYSEIHGDFLGNLRDWHVARMFTPGQPQSLNKQFITVGSAFPMRQFAVMTGIPYLAQFGFDLKIWRKLSKRGTPRYFGRI